MMPITDSPSSRKSSWSNCRSRHTSIRRSCNNGTRVRIILNSTDPHSLCRAVPTAYMAATLRMQCALSSQTAGEALVRSRHPDSAC